MTIVLVPDEMDKGIVDAAAAEIVADELHSDSANDYSKAGCETMDPLMSSKILWQW